VSRTEIGNSQIEGSSRGEKWSEETTRLQRKEDYKEASKR